jgi:hypothetical protein
MHEYYPKESERLHSLHILSLTYKDAYEGSLDSFKREHCNFSLTKKEFVSYFDNDFTHEVIVVIDKNDKAQFLRTAISIVPRTACNMFYDVHVNHAVCKIGKFCSIVGGYKHITDKINTKEKILNYIFKDLTLTLCGYKQYSSDPFTHADYEITLFV